MANIRKCTDFRIYFLRERPVWDDVTCVDWREETA